MPVHLPGTKYVCTSACIDDEKIYSMKSLYVTKSRQGVWEISTHNGQQRPLVTKRGLRSPGRATVQSWMTIKKTEILAQHEFLKPVPYVHVESFLMPVHLL